MMVDAVASRGRYIIRQARVGAAPGVDLERILDIALAFAALLFFCPLIILVALAIKLQDRGPVLFRQSRIGRYGVNFGCLKFRSMAVDADRRLEALLRTDPRARIEWEQDHKLRQDPRVTRLGAWLRRSSLDELPQLLNVLKGEMSMVGPRPIVYGEAYRYGKYLSEYCAIRPGITGLWQVSGRNDVSYRRRIAMDVAYARSKCLGAYVGILLATAPAVLLRRGSY